ncbi:hypothetical protein FIBSPDRAFT_913910 [Athelia psychrophila]|uniref:Uncharacterized protein n=1 Tax=Athelia psychrophila TaxID=1759441 RepID=A0A165Z2T5_9AGAM|nr:hypothetical protein FIBSPDRAFT_913910 [Fibularhizoctonia sp. CBS 109695]
MVSINGQNCRALADTGSLGDFMSTTLTGQFKLKYENLDKPLILQLAVSGSQSTVNRCTTVKFEYQEISEQRPFNIINIDSYNLILRTPWLYQHRVSVRFRSVAMFLYPLKGAQLLTLQRRYAELRLEQIAELRKRLVDYATEICKEAKDTPLPLFREINHTIPLIDENKCYVWRPVKWPKAMKPLWREKCDDYLATGRWQFQSRTNTVPMLMLKKLSKDNILRLRTAAVIAIA